MMPRPRRRRRSALPLFLLCLALGYLIYFEIGSSPTVLQAGPADLPPPEQVAALPDQPGFAMPPIESFSEIATRPLFSESRRPPIPEAEPEGEPEPEPEQIAVPDVRRGLFVLVGVVITDQVRMAIVRQRNAKEAVRLFKGQQIEGWTVVSIEPDRVLFRQGAEVDEIRLDDALAPPPAAPRLKRRTPREQRERRLPDEPGRDERRTNR